MPLCSPSLSEDNMVSEYNMSVSPCEGAAYMLSVRRRGGFRTEYDEAFLYMYILLGPV